MTVRWKPFYGWWVLLSAALVLMAAFSMTSYALPVFYPELVKTLHWSRAKLALGGSMKTLLIGLVAPLNGWIIDRRGVKTILLAGLVTLAISFALLSGIHSLWQWYVLCLCIGAAGSWVHHLPTQLLVANWFAKNRGLTIGLLMTASGFGDALMPLASVTLIKSLGWREAALLLPLILTAPLLAVIFLVRNQPQDMGLLPDGASEQRPAGTARIPAGAHSSAVPALAVGIFKTAAYWMLAALLLFIGWSTFSVWQHLVLYLRDQGFSQTMAASLFSLFLAASTVSRFLCGPLSDKITATHTMLINLVFMASAFASLITTRSPAVIYLCMILFGLGYGGSITCRPLIVFEYYGATGIGRAYGAATALFTFGGFIGPALSGYIFDKTGSYGPAFVLALVLICVATALVILLKRSMVHQRDRAEAARGSLLPSAK